jgi:hypothetical protein
MSLFFLNRILHSFATTCIIFHHGISRTSHHFIILYSWFMAEKSTAADFYQLDNATYAANALQRDSEVDLPAHEPSTTLSDGMLTFI